MDYTIPEPHLKPQETYPIRLEYAALLFFYYSKQELPEKICIRRACGSADVSPHHLKQWLINHRKRRKAIRNNLILEYRSQGYPIDFICEAYSVDRTTVFRITDRYRELLDRIPKKAKKRYYINQHNPHRLEDFKGLFT